MTVAATVFAKHHSINDVRAEPSSGKFHHLLEEVAVAIKSSLSFQQAMQDTLELLCRHLKWPVGRIYFMHNFARTARDEPIPSHPHPISPLWRGEAESGLKAAFGFPVLVGGKVKAVLEFVSPESANPPDELLEVMKRICRQLEQAYERDRSAERLQLRDEHKEVGAPAAINAYVPQKKPEEAPKQSEECLRLVVEGVRDYAIFMLDAGGRVATWNTGAERIKGYQSQEILGQHFSHLYEPHDIEQGKPEQALEAAASSGRFEDEGWRLRKDGSRFWANVVLTALRSSEGKLLGFSTVTRDLTEHRRLEQELQRERDRLRLVLDLNNSCASDLDLPQLFTAISAGLRSITLCDAVILALPDLERDDLRVYAADFPEGKGLLKQGSTYSAKGSIDLPFEGEPDWLDPAMRDFLVREGLHSICALPLISRRIVVGCLSLACFRENAFAQEDLDLLGTVAGQVAIAVQNTFRYHQVPKSRGRLTEGKLLRSEIRPEHDCGEIVGRESGLRKVLKQVETVAGTDSTVLILGETGTGKELIARAIHNLSSRRDRSFVGISCASIPAGLLESELFGHEKGAFTGAIARKIGRFELADHGTLFLDEVGDIPLELQSKLLRVLQEQAFERLGSARTTQVDVRLVAATNRELNCMVDGKQFRSDLYYRINVFPVELPPLRERRQDIRLLVRHFVDYFAHRMKKRIDSVPPEAMDALVRYSWPGNVRELQNLIERAVILSPGAVLCVPLADLKTRPRTGSSPLSTLEEVQRGHIMQALRDTDWVVGGPHGAAARLGLRRTTLLYKMQRLNIARPGHGEIPVSV